MTRLDLKDIEHPFARMPSTVWISSDYVTNLVTKPDYFPYVIAVTPASGHGSDGHPDGMYGCHAPAGSICAANWLITFKGVGIPDQIYLVGHYDMCKDAWKATWPD